MNVGAAVKHYREGEAMSVAELAARAGVTRNTIWNWERGRSEPTVSQLDAVMRELGRTINDAVEYGETPEEEPKVDDNVRVIRTRSLVVLVDEREGLVTVTGRTMVRDDLKIAPFATVDVRRVGEGVACRTGGEK